MASARSASWSLEHQHAHIVDADEAAEDRMTAEEKAENLDCVLNTVNAVYKNVGTRTNLLQLNYRPSSA